MSKSIEPPMAPRAIPAFAGCRLILNTGPASSAGECRWTYQPADRLARWNCWLARHDLLPAGCLSPHLEKILS